LLGWAFVLRMPMKKTPNPPKKSSPVPPPPAGPIPATTDLAALLTRWPMVPVPPRLPLDPRAAASLVLSEILPVLADKALTARFASLPKSEWNPQALIDLPLVAQAVLLAGTELASAQARSDLAKLPEDLLTEATAVKSRMLRVLDYLLGEEELVARELSAIRSGTGYLDLAQDLAQLAKLYQSERAQLQKDRHLYQATDETLAATLAQRIFSELRRDQPVAQRERLGQATALLLHLYDEVAATARWLLRNKPEEAAQRFPSLIAASRRPPKKAAKPTPDAPPA